MDETSQILLDTANRLFKAQFEPKALYAAESGAWPAAEWMKIEEAGFPLALVAEDQGGVGLEDCDALSLIQVAGAFAVPLPLAETILANRLLAFAGLPLAEGPASFAPARLADELTLVKTSEGWRVTGTLHRVPWARVASIVVGAAVIDGQVQIVRLPKEHFTVTPSVNIAAEPRDTMKVDTQLAREHVAPLPGATSLIEVFALGAVARSAAMAGACGRILEMTVNYANERVQFGRPIGKFQAIQQNLAVMAGQVAAARGAADIGSEGIAHLPDLLRVAISKARTGEAAGIVAQITHQVHGAIGFTHEHSLHFLTRRLWSWRDEFGDEVYWNRIVGRQMVAAGADGVWPLLATI